MEKSAPSSGLLCALVACAVSFLTGLDALGQGGAAAGVPPQPVQQTARVPRGGSVEIPLRIYGTRNQKLEFRIRQAPRAGTLSEIRQIDQEVASVTYTPPADLSITREKFTYAVKSTEGISAGADVFITIVDSPPRLVAPVALDFSRVLLGETAAKQIEIANRGGGIAEGTVEVDPPWRIEGPRDYRLGAGDLRIFRVIFAPVAPGTFRGDVRFTSQPDRATALSGEAVAAITFSPAKLTLRHDLGDPVRSGAFDVINNTAQEQRLTLHASERLAFPRSLNIPAGEKATVLVQMAASDVAAIDEEIRVEQPWLTARLPVRADGVAAIFRAHRTSINFGRIPAGTLTQETVTIENLGGRGGAASVRVAPPFFVDESSIALEPGVKKELAVRIHPPEAGTFRADLKLVAPTGEIVIPLDALAASSSPGVAAPPRMAASSRQEKARKPGVRRESAPTREPIAGTVMPRTKITAVTPTTATIEWPRTNTGETNFTAQWRKLSREKRGDLNVEWIDYRAFDVAAKDRVMTATFRDLQPGQHYTMRLLTMGKPGEDPTPLLQVQFRTAGASARRMEFRAMPLLLAALAICITAIAWTRFARR